LAIFFDDQFPSGEQIPRRMEIHFCVGHGPFGDAVRLVVNGLQVGDPLTDNGWSETGYRWHDALHLAQAVCLGWSPIFRSLAGLKRRSDPRTDHIEDGGRAAVADEAIAWAVFCHARTRGWYRDRRVDGDLLDYVEEMAYGLEVAIRSRSEWLHAIRTGLGCMLALWESNGGILLGDLHRRTLVFRPTVSYSGTGRYAPAAASISEGTDTRSAEGSAETPV
jgi:MazG C-terminal domain